MLKAIDVEIEHPVVAPTIDVPIAIQTSIKAVLVNLSPWRRQNVPNGGEKVYRSG